MTQVITGPIWAARNWSADEGEGSIHDDATAAKLLTDVERSSMELLVLLVVQSWGFVVAP